MLVSRLTHGIWQGRLCRGNADKTGVDVIVNSRKGVPQEFWVFIILGTGRDGVARAVATMAMMGDRPLD